MEDGYLTPAQWADLQKLKTDPPKIISATFLEYLAGQITDRLLGNAISKAKQEISSARDVVTAEGQANAATYPKLKDQLLQQNLSNIASQDVRLAAAVHGSADGNINFSIGKGTAAEADLLGRIWVGDGARPMTGVQGGLVSADGTRLYRPPSAKPNTPAQYAPTGVQANFQQLQNGVVTSNGHLNITQP